MKITCDRPPNFVCYAFNNNKHRSTTFRPRTTAIICISSTGFLTSGGHHSIMAHQLSTGAGSKSKFPKHTLQRPARSVSTSAEPCVYATRSHTPTECPKAKAAKTAPKHNSGARQSRFGPAIEQPEAVWQRSNERCPDQRQSDHASRGAQTTARSGILESESRERRSSASSRKHKNRGIGGRSRETSRACTGVERRGRSCIVDGLDTLREGTTRKLGL